MDKPRIAFVCTHNARRSQMAEAIANHLGGNVATFLSAGTELANEVDPLAREAVRNLYGVEMGGDYRPKVIEEILPVNSVITMGCDVECPVVLSDKREDWKLNDPAGKSIEAFERSAQEIFERVVDLLRRLN